MSRRQSSYKFCPGHHTPSTAALSTVAYTITKLDLNLLSFFQVYAQGKKNAPLSSQSSVSSSVSRYRRPSYQHRLHSIDLQHPEKTRTLPSAEHTEKLVRSNAIQVRCDRGCSLDDILRPLWSWRSRQCLPHGSFILQNSFHLHHHHLFFAFVCFSRTSPDPPLLQWHRRCWQRPLYRTTALSRRLTRRCCPPRNRQGQCRRRLLWARRRWQRVPPQEQRCRLLLLLVVCVQHRQRQEQHELIC